MTPRADVPPTADLELGPLQRQDPIATFDAIRHLDRHLGATTDPLARGILRRAVRYLEADLLKQLSGIRGDRRRETRRVPTDRRDTPTHGGT